ncbi:MAG TPA: hypothetical protein VGQ09_22390 [Chitinophagaceae bacterium]|jgi:hypothetical protein|nr:hypothetical protein [Chitinophagaceae bacterium]
MNEIKNILIGAACLLVFEASGQDKEKFDGKKWEAPYTLEIPKSWDVERFLIPIAFASTIPYNGIEDIRFTPGWGKKETNEYWTYAFLWFLDGRPKFNSKIIEKNLKAYYTGLTNINIDKKQIDTTKLTQVTVSIQKRSSYQGDLKTFEGTVSMIDYMTRKPIIVNLIVHIKFCEGQNKTFVFHEISPKPYTDLIWDDLNRLWANFKCTKE